MTFKRITVIAAFCIGTGAAHADLLEKPVLGPKLICFKYSAFRLAEGERVTTFSGSAEGMAIEIEGHSGSFSIGESEIYAPTKRLRRLVFTSGRMSVYRVSGRSGHYAIYGPTSFSDGKNRLLIRLAGKNLKGGNSDRRVYERFIVRDTAALKCQHTFTYSWDFLDQ